MLRKIEGRRRRGWGWDGWMASLTRWTWVWASSRRQWRQEACGCSPQGLKEWDTEWLNKNNEGSGELRLADSPRGPRCWDKYGAQTLSLCHSYSGVRVPNNRAWLPSLDHVPIPYPELVWALWLTALKSQHTLVGRGEAIPPGKPGYHYPRKRKGKEVKQANISHFTVSYQILCSRENEVPECVFTWFHVCI